NVLVRDVQGQDAVARDALEVKLEGLAGQEVHGDRIAREGIDDEDVEGACRTPLKGEPPVPRHDLDVRQRPFEKAELSGRQPDHQRIDLVEDVEISEPPVAGDGSGPE